MYFYPTIIFFTMKYVVQFIITFSLVIFNIESKSAEKEWKYYKAEFNKSYESNKEDIKRYKVFKENSINIKKHNKRYENGDETYLQEVNRFADLTDDEFTAIYGLYERSDPVKYSADEMMYNDTDEYLDLRETGGLTPAKDQGLCGSCFIFSVVGNFEYYNFKKTGELISLSEQYIIDCFSNTSCFGGNPGYIFLFVEEHGIYFEEDFPYKGKQNECTNNTELRSNITFETVGVVQGTDDNLKMAIKNHGPLTTCLSATANWRFYKSGVWYHDQCAEASNHCVLVVGYGTENGNDYWLIKNSFGSQWGDNGYIKMARNKHKNYCGFHAGLYLI